ncbi:MAG: 3-dehydroquinate synthase [Planctomycetales bacterium]|nr:3-dehydroquinate synthase [Planctomycetales bacterium]
MAEQPQSTPADLSSQAIRVHLADRSYPIHIGRHLLPSLAGWIGECLPKCRHAVIAFDQQVDAIATEIASQLQAAEFRTTTLSVPSGETSKSVAAVERLWQAMLDDHTDRGSLVVAVGGGVVGDLAGFAAASFARGIALVQVPTTLLSQVDSSVGGKTGINLPGTKNIVGAFWQPSLVVIDTQSLDTLPRREYVSGLAEVLKYGVILVPELFDYLEQHTSAVLARDAAAVTHIVAESCRAKADVVRQDERETTGLRAILNYGHTFAHALESVAGYGTLLHGEAVAIGMHMAAVLAHRLQRVPLEFVQRQEQLLTALELPTQFAAADGEQLWQAMQHDKKVEHGTLRFVLPRQLGQVELVAGVAKEQVLAALSR